MGLSWFQYTLFYYGLQCALFFFIYIFLIIFIPYDLMGWNLKTLFSMDDAKEKDKSSNDCENQRKNAPNCSECDKIWNCFGNFFTNGQLGGSAILNENSDDRKNGKPCTCCNVLIGRWDWLKKKCFGRCQHTSKFDLENRKMPHDYDLFLEKKHEQWYCGCIKLNLKRIGIYVLLCACIWCASVAFFESVILSYASVSNGDSCPIPKKATDATIVDCFIFQRTLDTSPTNNSFPTQCNGTVALLFSGVRADCFAWTYAQVEVVDVIEELGICAGIVALLGTVVAVISYLCQHHRWRLLSDITACLAVAGIPILVYRDGSVPFLTYILLGSLAGTIMITEYLLGYVPLLTWLCLARRICRCSKAAVGNDNKSKVTPIKDSSA